MSKKENIFDYIVAYKAESGGVSPSYRDMAKYFNTSTSVIRYHLDKLAADGRIALPEKGLRRGIRVVGERWTYGERSSSSKMEFRQLSAKIEELEKANAILRLRLSNVDHHDINHKLNEKNKLITTLREQIKELEDRLDHNSKVLKMSRVTGGFDTVEKYREALQRESKRLAWDAWESKEKKQRRAENNDATD